MKAEAYIITDLIQMDIINYKLVSHFQLMGIDLDDYALGIDRIVFELMDIQDRPDIDDIFERYMREYESVIQMSVKHDSSKIEQLAKSLYNCSMFMQSTCGKSVACRYWTGDFRRQGKLS